VSTTIETLSIDTLQEAVFNANLRNEKQPSTLRAHPRDLVDLAESIRTQPGAEISFAEGEAPEDKPLDWRGRFLGIDIYEDRGRHPGSWVFGGDEARPSFAEVHRRSCWRILPDVPFDAFVLLHDRGLWAHVSGELVHHGPEEDWKAIWSALDSAQRLGATGRVQVILTTWDRPEYGRLASAMVTP